MPALAGGRIDQHVVSVLYHVLTYLTCKLLHIGFLDIIH